MMLKTNLLLCEILGTYHKKLILYIFIYLYYIKNIYLQLIVKVDNRHCIRNIFENKIYI